MPRIGAGARAGVVAGGRHGDSGGEGAVAEVEAAAADIDGSRRGDPGRGGQSRRNGKNEDTNSHSRSGLKET